MALQYGHQDLLKTAVHRLGCTVQKEIVEGQNIPTALSSMIPCALVFAADMAAGLTLEPKKRRRKEMLGRW